MHTLPPPMEPASTIARNLFRSEPVDWEKVEENDWISCGWNRPRLVQEVVEVDGQKVLYLAEPDAERWSVGEFRTVTFEDWNAREAWVRFPWMRVIWVSAG